MKTMQKITFYIKLVLAIASLMVVCNIVRLEKGFTIRTERLSQLVLSESGRLFSNENTTAVTASTIQTISNKINKTGNNTSNQLQQRTSVVTKSPRNVIEVNDDGHGTGANLTVSNHALLSPKGNIDDNVIYPITPQKALQLYGDKLTEYEREEILNYSKIWFLGLGADKLKGVAGVKHSKVTGDSGEHIAYRYEIVKLMGLGGFGQVFTCKDHVTGDLVAIKLNRKKNYMKKAWREVNTMSLLTKQDKNNQYNIVHMLNHFTFRSHLCIVMELMGRALHRPVSHEVLPIYAESLLQALSLLHSEGVIHRDIKLLNILHDRNNKSKVKLSDFGEACYEKDCQPRENVQTYYKAPETFLDMRQTTAIDMWGLARILGDFYLQQRPHLINDRQQLMASIVKLIGTPPKSMLDPSKAPEFHLYFDSDGTPNKNMTSIMQRLPSGNITTLFTNADPLFRNFISKCLVWDPNLRMTPDEALQHPWIQSHRNRNITVVKLNTT